MSTNWVFPRRNLPDESEPWGREVETAIRGVSGTISATETALNNSQRGTSSQLAVVSRQITELSDRSISEFPLSVSNASISSVGTGSVNIPASSGRAAVVVYNSEFSVVSGQGAAFLSILQDGSVVSRTSGFMISNPPSGFPQGAVSAGFATTIPTGGSIFTVRLEVVEFVSPYVVQSLSPKFNIYYGNPV